MVPLRTKLRTGDIVEIVTQKDHKPSRDWLTFVKSPRARNKIKHWLNEDQRAAPSRSAASCWSARPASSRCP
jgi:GTP diphosphokinase / guanosine-3',5'-bis(diphosphate) 3'-diphosphatase